MAFQDFAQKHSKSDMQFLTLYCLIESFGSACSAVSCKLYLCVWVIFSGGGFVLLPQVMFFIFWKKKRIFFFSVLFNVPKVLYCLSFFFASTFAGGFNFFVVRFFLFYFFWPCCISRSMPGAQWSFWVLFCGQTFSREQKGGWKCGGRECAWHCHSMFTVLFWVLIALQSLLSFSDFLLTSVFLTYLI